MQRLTGDTTMIQSATRATSSRANSVAASITATDVALFIIRVTLGVIFFAHGAQKAFGWWGGHGLEATVDFFASTGIPPVLAYAAIFTELLGGLALIVGVLSRLAGVGLAIVMLVAMIRVHLPHGFFLGEGGGGIEFTLALFAMALGVAIAGPGKLALADLEGRLLARKS
jgi:putative oxidoreductase